MENLPDLNFSTEYNDKPNSNLKNLIALFFIFVVIGLFAGYFFSENIINSLDDPPKTRKSSTNNNSVVEETAYKGRIVFKDPNFFPEDNISFVLLDDQGNESVLLYSNDEKLVVAEGQEAEVYGSLSKTKDGMHQILIVDKLVIKNSPNQL